MPYLPTAQAFLEQSALLTSARPTTARITTKYNIPHPSPPPHPQKPSSLKRKDEDSVPEPSTKQSQSKTRYEARKKTATLTLKCYDPESGTCLKYKTDKQAEVGRLFAALGGCGRVMAGLPPKKAEEEKPEPAMDVDTTEKPAQEAGKPEVKEKEPFKESKGQAQSQAQGGGGKRKKKGKR